MKKSLFVLLSLFTLVLALRGSFLPALACLGVLLAWLGLETWRRQRPRFLAGNSQGRDFREQSFRLEGELFAFAASPDGKQALLVDAQGQARVLQTFPQRSLLWQQALPDKPLALALSRQPSRLYLAMESEVVGLDEKGRVFGRLSFAPPEQGAQAYRFHLSQDGKVLLLHTPWFVQDLDPGLKSLGPRLSSQEAGNFIKYLKLSPHGEQLFLGGALLLEEGAGVQARWALWQRTASGFSRLWQKEDENQDNTHIRALEMSPDGRMLAALIHRGGYEFSLYDLEGREVWKRQGQDPVFSSGGEFVLWQSPYEGLVLSEISTKSKLWARQPEAKVRLKAVNASGECLVLEGRRLLRLDSTGKILSEDWFQTDPHDLLLSQSGGLLAVLRQGLCGFIQVPE